MSGGKIKAKNARNAEAARQGKTKPRPAYADRQALEGKQKPAVAPWVVWAFVGLLTGGIFFELIRLFFPAKPLK